MINLLSNLMEVYHSPSNFPDPNGYFGMGIRSGPSQAVNPQRRTASDLTEITPDFYSSKICQLP
jgi:hypothetical protein